MRRSEDIDVLVGGAVGPGEAVAERLSRRWIAGAKLHIDDAELRHRVQGLITQGILVTRELDRSSRCDRAAVGRVLMETVEWGLDLATVEGVGIGAQSVDVGCAGCQGMVATLALACLTNAAPT